MPAKIYSLLDVIGTNGMFEKTKSGKLGDEQISETSIIIGRGEGPVSYMDVRNEWTTRRCRRDHLPESLFAEPAWDILLHLYATELSGGRSTVTQVIRASNVPVATAIRWIGHLMDFGLCRKKADDRDRRRQFVSLTPSGVQAMHEYFAEVRSPKRDLLQPSIF